MSTDGTPSPEGTSEPVEKKRDPATIPAIGCIVIFLVGVPIFLWSTCSGTSPLREESTAFLSDLRRGRLEDAYGRLAESRRSELTHEAFVATVARDVALGDHVDMSIQGTKSMERWGCTRGELRVGEDDWSFEIYLVMEGERWRVHTWALHPPALVTPMPLMERCGNW